MEHVINTNGSYAYVMKGEPQTLLERVWQENDSWETLRSKAAIASESDSALKAANNSQCGETWGSRQYVHWHFWQNNAKGNDGTGLMVSIVVLQLGYISVLQRLFADPTPFKDLSWDSFFTMSNTRETYRSFEWA